MGKHMKRRNNTERGLRLLPLVFTGLVACLWQSATQAEPARFAGFVDAASYYRDDVGWTKNRYTAQLEFSKALKARGAFSELSVHGTLRGSYDAVYDFNGGQFGENAGGGLVYAAPGNPALATLLGVPFPVSTTPQYAGVFPPPPIVPAPFGGTGA